MSGPTILPTGTHEHTINIALGEVLHQLGRAWTLRSEHVGRIFEEVGRPDILVEKSDGWPIVIEAEVGNHRQAEIEALWAKQRGAKLLRCTQAPNTP